MTLPMPRFALCLSCALLFASAAQAAPTKKKRPPPSAARLTEPTAKVAEALGATVLDSVVTATKVQVFRVTDSGGLRPDPA